MSSSCFYHWLHLLLNVTAQLPLADSGIGSERRLPGYDQSLTLGPSANRTLRL